MDLELKLYFTYNAEFLLRSTTLSFPIVEFSIPTLRQDVGTINILFGY